MELIDKPKLLQMLKDNFIAHMKYGLNDKAVSYKHIIDEIQSGTFDIKKPEAPDVKVGDKVTHKKHINYSVGTVEKISKGGKRAYVKWPRINIYSPHPAYYDFEQLMKEGEGNE